MCKDRFVLSYVREEVGELDFCDGYSFVVIIMFVCLLEWREGIIFKFIVKFNCCYEVEWIIEYVCYRDYLESKICFLSGE